MRAARCILLCHSVLLAACAGLPAAQSRLDTVSVTPGAELELSLEDISRADAAAPLIARKRLVLRDGPPFAFAIEYDAARIDAMYRDGLRAKIVANEQLWFASETSQPVLGSAGANNIALVVAAYAGRTTERIP